MFVFKEAKTKIATKMPTENVTEKATLRLELAPRSASATAQAPTLAEKQIDNISLSAENEGTINATENYVRVAFRAITGTIVGGYSWKATDFSDLQALKAATDFLIGKPAFKNHEMGNVESIIGVIESAKWTESNGKTPAGIDIVFKIDANKHPSLASSLTSTPPEIQSCSITVDFDWSPSHVEDYTDRDGKFLNWEFAYDVGKIGKDGKMVCRKVTKIHEIYECSLVGFGADPYAKILDSNGAPINPDRASIVNLAKEGKEIFMFVKEEEGVISEEVFAEVITEVSKKLSNMTDAIQKSESQLALAETFAKKHIEESQTLALTLRETQEKLSNSELSLEVFKIKAEKYDSHISLQKTEVIRLYKISQGSNKVQEAIISLIEKANEEELQAFGLQYGANLMQQFSGNCKSCGGKDIDFRSSLSEEMPLIIPLSNKEYNEKYKGKSMKL